MASGVVNSPATMAGEGRAQCAQCRQWVVACSQRLRQQPAGGLAIGACDTDDVKAREEAKTIASRLARGQVGTGATMMSEGRLGMRASSGSNRMAAAPPAAPRPPQNPGHERAPRRPEKAANDGGYQ